MIRLLQRSTEERTKMSSTEASLGLCP